MLRTSLWVVLMMYWAEALVVASNEIGLEVNVNAEKNQLSGRISIRMQDKITI
jgi:hypothetical protein